MCYDIKSLERAQLKRYRYWNEQNKLRDLEERIMKEKPADLYHASGFSHPKLYGYTNQEPHIPTILQWGLIPFWVKDAAQAKQIWNKTLNAKGETMFDLPSFRDASKSKRCLIYVDGFYEHHHFAGKTYPFYIHRKDMEPMVMAGIWSTWKNPEDSEVWTTFSIVTSKANNLLARIHNNPDLDEPRMPLILPESSADEWLMPIKNDADKQFIQSLIQPYNHEEMDAYTVGTLRGKNAVGNIPEVSNNIVYSELL